MFSDSPFRCSLSLVTLALLGCPSDDLPSGDASTGPGSESGVAETTAVESATGTLPPATTSSGSSSDDAADSSTTIAGSSGTTEGEGPSSSSDDGISGCDGNGQCCGNGIINGSETCDCGMMPCTPAGLDFQECAGLVNTVFPDRVYTGGILDCSPASCQLVFTTCTFCGDGNVNGNETCEPEPAPDDTCASLGLGEQTEPLPCDESCQLDTSSCA
jgi:hypothetical protein